MSSGKENKQENPTDLKIRIVIGLGYLDFAETYNYPHPIKKDLHCPQCNKIKKNIVYGSKRDIPGRLALISVYISSPVACWVVFSLVAYLEGPTPLTIL